MLRIILEKHHKGFIKNKLILKSQQTFRSEKNNVFTEEVNKIALSANDSRIKENNQWIQQKHMHMEGAKIYYVKKRRSNVTI